jgi:hypothetical protein
MLLGQLVAISVASNLFYFALLLSSSKHSASTSNATETREANATGSIPISVQPDKHGGSRLWFCTLLSLLTVALSPYTSERLFLPNLLLMHVLLVIPLLPLGTSPNATRLKLRPRSLYSLIAVLALLLRLRTTYSALPPQADTSSHTQQTLLLALWRTLHEHPAQASIGWDVIWTTISFLCWIVTEPRFKDTGFLVLLSSFITVGPISFVAPALIRTIEKDE